MSRFRTLWYALYLFPIAAALSATPRRTVLRSIAAAPAAARAGRAGAAPPVRADRAGAASPAAPPPLPVLGDAAALDAAGSVYALARARDGGAAVSVSLDRAGRVRSALFFYETRRQAGEVRRAVAAAAPKRPELVVARVPLADAMARCLRPPYKQTGCPGYFCGRLLLDRARARPRGRGCFLGDAAAPRVGRPADCGRDAA